MQDPATNPTYTSLYEDIYKVKDQMAVLSNEILSLDISKYPIFIAHKTAIELGKPAFILQKHTTSWNISISILEDLVNKEIVSMSKVEDFKKVYKDPTKHFCILVITSDQIEFVFVPK